MTYRQAKHWEHRLYEAGFHQTRVEPTPLESGRYDTNNYRIVIIRTSGREAVVDSTDLARSYIAERKP